MLILTCSALESVLELVDSNNDFSADLYQTGILFTHTNSDPSKRGSVRGKSS